MGPRYSDLTHILLALSIVGANVAAALFVWWKVLFSEGFMSPFRTTPSLPIAPFMVAILPLTAMGTLTAAALSQAKFRTLLIGINLLSLASTWGIFLVWMVLLLIF